MPFRQFHIFRTENIFTNEYGFYGSLLHIHWLESECVCVFALFCLQLLRCIESLNSYSFFSKQMKEHTISKMFLDQRLVNRPSRSKSMRNFKMQVIKISLDFRRTILNALNFSLSISLALNVCLNRNFRLNTEICELFAKWNAFGNVYFSSAQISRNFEFEIR